MFKVGDRVRFKAAGPTHPDLWNVVATVDRVRGSNRYSVRYSVKFDKATMESFPGMSPFRGDTTVCVNEEHVMELDTVYINKKLLKKALGLNKEGEV